MSQFDGTGEKRNDGGDSGAFRGRRHPFLDRRVDWKAIDKARHGGETGGAEFADRIGMPREVVPFQLTNEPDPRDQRMRACVTAIKQMSTNQNSWDIVRNSLIEEYQSAGPDPKNSDRALMSFIGAVNRRLKQSGEIHVERVSADIAQQIAAAERVEDPQLCLNFRVWHSGGLLGPIGIAFKNQKS